MAHVQPSYNPQVPKPPEPLTSGGNSTITNGNECDPLARTAESVPVRTEGMQEPGRH